jgi:hypothetical protein
MMLISLIALGARCFDLSVLTTTGRVDLPNKRLDCFQTATRRA